MAIHDHNPQISTTRKPQRQGQMNGPETMVFVGPPDAEEPHRDLSRLQKFLDEHPQMRFINFIDGEAESERLKGEYAKLKVQEGGRGWEVVTWKGEPETIKYFFELGIARMAGAQVRSPMWFKCPEGHITHWHDGQADGKCSECGGAAALVQPYHDQLARLAKPMERVISLTNFDTRSGKWLYANVNPTANAMFNSGYALCEDSTRRIEVEDLVGTDKGKPVLVVGSGPSLEGEIDNLRRLQNKVTIVSVARNFKMLASRGVYPKYVFSCEMFNWDSVIFDGVTDSHGAIFCYTPITAPETVKKWPGARCCVWDAITAELLGRGVGVTGGNSVSHICFNLANEVLGADPIILVGQDLAYTKPRTHAEGTLQDFPKEADFQDRQFQAELWVPCTAKKDDFDPFCHRTPVAFGRGSFAPSRLVEVRSSPSYRDFATLFELLITNSGKKVYNACAMGQKISGTEYLDLNTYNP